MGVVVVLVSVAGILAIDAALNWVFLRVRYAHGPAPELVLRATPRYASGAIRSVIQNVITELAFRFAIPRALVGHGLANWSAIAISCIICGIVNAYFHYRELHDKFRAIHAAIITSLIGCVLLNMVGGKSLMSVVCIGLPFRAVVAIILFVEFSGLYVHLRRANGNFNVYPIHPMVLHWVVPRSHSAG